MNQINPFIREAWDSVLDHSIPERVLFDYELLYLKSGGCTITVRDRVYEGKQGDFFLFRPRVPHSIQVPENIAIKKVYIHFDVEYFDNASEIPVNFTLEDQIPPEQLAFFRPDVLADSFPGIADCFHSADSRILENLLEKVIYHHTHQSNLVDQMEEKQVFLNLLTRVLYELQLVSMRAEEGQSLAAFPIKMYLDNHLNENISLDDLSHNCGISKYYLIALFKKDYGITPHRYHQLQRISHAQYLLRFTNLNVTEIAESLGFESLPSFSNLFKRVVGVTPSQYAQETPRQMVELQAQA